MTSDPTAQAGPVLPGPGSGRLADRIPARGVYATTAAPAGPVVAGGEWAGPWDQAFWFEVPCEMRSKSNARRGKDPRTREQWRSQKAYESAVAQAARAQLPRGWDVGDPAVGLPRRPQIVSFIFARSAIDAANFSKSTLDAVEGIVYVTDASVRYSGALGIRARKDPVVHVAFARLPASARPQDVLAAASALNDCWADEFPDHT